MAAPDIDTLFKAFDDYGYSSPPISIAPIRSHECSGCGDDGGKIAGVCRACGLCDNNNIHDGAEWVSGVDESGKAHDPSRVGMPSDPLYSDNWGKTLMIKTDWKTRQKYGFMARLNFHGGMNHRDRALWKSYNEFDTVGKENLNLTANIVTAAKGYYKKFSESQLTRGAVRSGIKANCLFWACKDNGVPRTTQEIATAFNISTKDISRTFDNAREVIKPRSNGVTRPVDMIPRIFGELDLHMDKGAHRISQKCKTAASLVAECPTLMGKTPSAVASVTIYRVLLNTDYEITKDDIARAANISMATINKIDNIVKDLLPK
tara:strand:- start:4773 stop:5729 length:957 start_codon:yes stop_codon:yes gene_type:complete